MSTKAESVEAQPHYERIFTALRDDIVQRRILGGEKLSEADLARRFEVSRTPIREALHRLEKAGFVTLAPNVGATVIKVSGEALRQYAELLIALESYAVEMAAPLIAGSAHLERMAQWQRDMQRALAEESLPAYERANEAFHRLFLDLCDNEKLTETVSELRNRLYMTATEGRFSVMRIKSCIEAHQRVLDAIIDGEPYRAAIQMRAHLRDVCDSMLHNRGF